MEDAELVKKMISGDMDAFDRLMEQYQAEALRAAYLISGNHADSEDIVQETFVSCYLNRSQIKNPEAFRSWFYKSLSRNAWLICKRRRREQPAEEVYEERPSSSSVLSEVIRDEEEREICRAIESLPVKQRTVIVLYYYNQMSIREIAKVCGCLEGTVKSRLFGGKARLKKLLEDMEQKGEKTWTILS